MRHNSEVGIMNKFVQGRRALLVSTDEKLAPGKRHAIREWRVKRF
jgi:hypothetical protein